MITEQDQWIRHLNKLLAEDVMHGIQWCDLDDDEQHALLGYFAAGCTPEETIEAIGVN